MTVAVLAIGLVATGAGATVFLRNALMLNLDSTLDQLVRSDVATSLIDFDDFTVRDDAAPTDYTVALYSAEQPGIFLVQAGGGVSQPEFPTEFGLDRTIARGTTPFTLTDAATGAEFRASVAPIEVADRGGFLTQMVALPIAPVDRIVATFLGIYGVLALITIVAGALLTRWLVTLTFRSLGQVESTAMTIAAGDFSQRMTDIEPNTTEVGRLKTAINTMLGRVDYAISQRDDAVRQMRRFIGDASHELRTPLVTVRGYAELYRMGALASDEDIAQAMERIEREAVRMGELVEDLLALARLDERRDIVIGPVDLRPIARDAALDLGAAAPARPVTVVDTTVDEPEPRSAVAAESTDNASADALGKEHGRRKAPTTSAIARASGATLSLLRRRPKPAPGVAAPAPEPAEVDSQPGTAVAASEQMGGEARPAPIVLGDENRIRQVVTNLLGNARRFTPEDSPIGLRVGVDRVAGTGWIEVIDHGEGVPEQIRSKIFQRFWRADNSRARTTGGAGLGLSIVASIVDSLHGGVDVLETPGGGATFRVSFPLAQRRDAADHAAIETQPIAPLRMNDA